MPSKPLQPFLKLAGVVLCLTTSLASQDVRSDITAYLEEVLLDTKAVSISVAIGLNDKVLFRHAVGHANIEANKLATAKTVYRSGSIAKVITTVAAMQLVENDLLELNSDIRDFVPDYPQKPWPVTVGHILTHTSGIRHYQGEDFGPAGNLSPYFPTTLSALSFFKDDDLLFEPGTQFQYSTYSFTLLQAVIEAASQETFEAYLKESIWAPAGMTQTELEIPPRQPAHMAIGYYRNKENENLEPVAPHNVSYKYAGGGMLTTPTDLVKLLQSLQSNTLLAEDTRQIMWRKKFANLQSNQAYGWRVEERNGQTIIHMGGSISGFKSFCIMWPDSGLSLAVMVNRNNYAHREKIAFDIFDQFAERLGVK